MPTEAKDILGFLLLTAIYAGLMAWTVRIIVRGYRTNVIYLGSRFGERWQFVKRSRHPVLYWIAMILYTLSLGTGTWVFLDIMLSEAGRI